uniref:Murine leukemia virus integrase C-terminal domain-containing protein n=1 Tax=Pseudonaja textilis TaxID=8673 RepID=A0A670Z1L8_PSETE
MLQEDQHPHEVGDWILIKTWRTEKLQPSWEGPYQVLLTTESAVWMKESGWTHCSRVKAASEPEKPWKSHPVEGQPLKLTLRK